MNSDDAAAIGRLHIKGIPTGFISSLGQEFVETLYGAIADSPTSFGFVAEWDRQVAAFVAYTTDLGRLYKDVLKKRFFRFSILLARTMLSPRSIRRMFQTLFYASNTKKMELPDAELLSIVVAPDARGQGLGRRLVLAGLDECWKRDLDSVKVLVAAENEPANTLYTKCGFVIAQQIDSHGVPSNIYVIHRIRPAEPKIP